MPTPLITVVVCLPDGAEFAVRTMFGVAPMVGDTIRYAEPGAELDLDVWDRILSIGPSAGAELKTTISGPAELGDELVLDVLDALRFRKRN